MNLVSPEISTGVAGTSWLVFGKVPGEEPLLRTVSSPTLAEAVVKFEEGLYSSMEDGEDRRKMNVEEFGSSIIILALSKLFVFGTP